MIRRLLQLILVIGGISATLLLLRLTPLQKPLEHFIQKGIAPFLVAGYSVRAGIHSFFDSRYSDRHLLEKLQADVIKLERENALCNQAENENSALRKQLNFSQKQASKPIPAAIIGSSEEHGSHMLILDRGSREGGLVGSGVIAEEGIFVGTIYAVRESVSFLLLPSDDRSRVIVSVFKNGVELSGIAHGRFRIGIIMDKVQQTMPLTAGDSVISAALNNNVPSGLLMGTVSEVTSNPNDLFQEATITPAISYDTLRIVSVVAK